MAPPGFSSSSHSPVRRKRKSSPLSESSDEDQHSRIKSKKHVKKDNDYKFNPGKEKRSESVSSSSIPEGRWKHDKWKSHDSDGFARPMDQGSSRHDSTRDRRSQSRSHFEKERQHRAMDDFMDHRRQERERITLVGVEQVWGKSPNHTDE